MTDWLQKHSWSLLIVGAALISNYAVYGYRISDLEREIATDEQSIASLNTQQVQTQVALAQIQVDLTYIKASVDRIVAK